MSETIRLIAEFFAACIGTIAFALLFQVPRKYYLYCGIAGACGWICYKLILPYTTEPVSIFFATVLVIILSRSFAVYKRCPVTVFLIAGIFPLVPGSGIYWTAFYVVTNDLEQAGAKRVSDAERCGCDCARYSLCLRVSAELVPQGVDR